MTAGDTILATFVDRLEKAETMDALRGVLSDALANLGFRHGCYHVVRLDGGTTRLPYVLHNYGDAWGEHYFRENYLDIDPILASTPDRTLPFLWADTVEFDSLSRDQRRMFDDATDAGLTNGFSVPLWGGQGGYATLSVIPDGKDPARAQALIAERANLIHLMAFYFDKVARGPLINDRLSSRRQKTLLSPREQEALRWTARGKTSSEIAGILGLSAKSVEFHLDNAKRKLGTFSKTHAVVKALTLGLVAI